MALRLNLFPVIDVPLVEGTIIYPESHLQFHRDYRVFAQIQGFPDNADGCMEDLVNPARVATHLLPHGVKLAVAGEDGYRYVTSGGGGDPIQYAMAGELACLEVPDDSEDPNHAILAFLKAISPDTKVLLAWE